MILSLITCLTISLALSSVLASGPLSLGIWVLLLAFLVSSCVSFSFSSWFALILFLIYIGGMLVMFAYFTALIPNQPLQMFKIIFILGLTSLALILSIWPSKALNPSFYNSNSSLPITSIISSSNIPIFLLIAIILFFILVAVVKVTNLSKGPLRPFN